METLDIQPILVPVDFSEESKAALLFASNLSVREERPLVVLHVIHDNGHKGRTYSRGAKESALPIREIAEQVMLEFISEVHEEHTNLDALKSARTMVVDGLPVTRILEVARNINAEHVVVGGNERGSLSRMLNGSVSQSLAKDSPIPVTVIRCKV